MSRLRDASPDLLAILPSLCDDAASQADLDQLERLVGQDKASMILLLDYVQLHSDLQIEFAGRKCSDTVLQTIGLLPIGENANGAAENAYSRDAILASGETASETDASSCAEGRAFEDALAKPPAPLFNVLGAAFHGTVAYFSQEVPFSFLIAALLLGAGLLVAAFTSVSEPVQLARQPRNDPVAWTPETTMEFVGRITGMVNCRWADASTAAFDSAYVPLGRRYALTSGLMEITYNTGATVILQGPATYEVDSEQGGFLSVGKLTASLGERGEEVARGLWSVASKSQASSRQPLARSASSDPKSKIQNRSSPASLFAIRTPTVTVTDLGTEFGVEVAPTGITESHVFRGKVKLEFVDGDRAAPGNEVVLTAHESARVEKQVPGGDGPIFAVHRGVAMPEGFVRTKQFEQLTPRGAVTWQLPTKVGGVNDILINGRLVHAGHWAGWDANNHEDIDVIAGSETIRFALRPNNASDGCAGIRGGYAYSPPGLFDAPPDFDPPFARVLGGFAQNWDAAPPLQTLTLRKLTPGRKYQIQLFTADGRGGARRVQSWSDSLTHRNRSATFCNGDVSNPPLKPFGAVSLVGTFTATTTSMRLYGDGAGVGVNKVSALNAYVLRDVTPADDEPAEKMETERQP